MFEFHQNLVTLKRYEKAYYFEINFSRDSFKKEKNEEK